MNPTSFILGMLSGVLITIFVNVLSMAARFLRRRAKLRAATPPSGPDLNEHSEAFVRSRAVWRASNPPLQPAKVRCPTCNVTAIQDKSGRLYPVMGPRADLYADGDSRCPTCGAMCHLQGDGSLIACPFYEWPDEDTVPVAILRGPLELSTPGVAR